MNFQQPANRSLEGIRVREVSHSVAAAHAGKVLAALGAEVWVEDQSSRACGHCLVPEVALAGFNFNKKTLIPSVGDAQRNFDVLISDVRCCPHTRLEGSGELAPWTNVDVGQIRVAISPYGSVISGASQSRGSAFTAAAVSGAASAIGRPDAQPLGLPQGVTETITGMNAAAACLAAILERDRDPDPPPLNIEVSLAGALEYFVGMNTKIFEDYPRQWLREGRRSSGSSGPYPLAIFEANDGLIGLIGRSREDWVNLLSAMGDPSWADDDLYRDPWHVAIHLADEVDAYVQAWTSRYSITELMSLSQQHNFIVAPVKSIRQVLDEPHHQQRPFWLRDESSNIVGSGLPFFDTNTANKTDSPRFELIERPVETAGRSVRLIEPAKILSGIKVLDLTWVWAGPLTTSILASLGAEVIKIEHPTRPDGSRMRGRPSRAGSPVDGPERETTPYFHQMGAGKTSFGANLTSPGAVQEVQNIAKYCDVVVENMRPGVLERRGLGYDTLSKLNPELIMLSLSVAGQNGPLSGIRGYAPVMSGLAGMESQVGYAPNDVTGTYTFALADPTAGLYGAIALLSAIRRRRHGSGGGVWIDLSQIEAAISTLSLPLAYELAGMTPEPAGNDDERFVLQDAFCCQGSDQWVALTVFTEAEMEVLLQLVTGADKNRRFTRNQVSGNDPQMSQAIEAWCRIRTRSSAVSELLSVQLTAAPVLRWNDDVLRREVIGDESSVSIFHPFGGRERIFVPPWEFDGVRPKPLRRAPLLGEHTARLLSSRQGDDDVSNLIRTGDLYTGAT